MTNFNKDPKKSILLAKALPDKSAPFFSVQRRIVFLPVHLENVKRKNTHKQLEHEKKFQTVFICGGAPTTATPSTLHKLTSSMSVSTKSVTSVGLRVSMKRCSTDNGVGLRTASNRAAGLLNYDISV